MRCSLPSAATSSVACDEAALSAGSGAWPPNNLRHIHGVKARAIASEISMPMLALIGIGLMYGPISPETNAMGNSAAMTVNVARIVGPPTSSTARGMTSASGARSNERCR